MGQKIKSHLMQEGPMDPSNRSQTFEMSSAEIPQNAKRPPSVDFMAAGYDQIAEPLSLNGASHNWIGQLYRKTALPAESSAPALVLGATSWICRLLREAEPSVIVVDKSPAMIKKVSAEFISDKNVALIEADWLGFLATCRSLGNVLGDLSLAFLPYPEGWSALFDALAERMSSRGKFIARFLSVAPGHKTTDMYEVVRQFVASGSTNFTALRVALLYTGWDRATWRIDTEEVLKRFQEEYSRLAPLLNEIPLPAENDLMTIEKYRGTGAVYYAPPLSDILQALSSRFHATAIHFGSYVMADYFPLVICELK